MDATIELWKMPAENNTAQVRLLVEREGIHVYLEEREVWIEVSEGGSLIVRAYCNQTSEDNFTTLVILHDKVIVG